MISNKNQTGFALSILVVCCIALLLFGYVGYRFVSNQSRPSANRVIDNSSSSVDTGSKESAPANSKTIDHTTQDTSTPVPPTPTSPEAQPPASPQPADPSPTITLLYRILSDGTPQLSPTSTTVSTRGALNIVLNLACASTCHFKLASDRYAFSNTAIYDSSQKISYTLDGKGNFLLYNELNPLIKFKLTIN